MHAKHCSLDTFESDHVSAVASTAPSHQPSSLFALDPSVYRPASGPSSSPCTRKPSLSAATPARLPRTSSLLPPPRAAAAAATTSATLTPAYSPSETPSFNAGFLHQSHNLPDTPPNESDHETDPISEPGTLSIEIPPLTLPPIVPLDSLSDSIGHRPSSLEKLPGGEVSGHETSGTSPARTHSASSSELLPKMPSGKVREPYAPSHGHSRSRSRSGKGSVDLTNKGRGTKPPSQKAMLSRALQQANTAVQLDNAQNFEGARQSYAEACDLLQHVLLKTTADEDKKKLEAIRRTYDARIEELDQMAPWRATDNKELPAPPGGVDEQDDEFPQAEVLEVETVALNPAKEQPDLQQQQQHRICQDTRYLSDGPREISRSMRLATEQPSLHSAFSRSPQKLRSTEEYMNDSDRATPQPLTNRRPSSPKKPQHERHDSDDRGTGTDSYHSGSWSGSRDGTGHFRDGSQNSWLDPIDESGGSSSTSVNSRDSSGLRTEHFRKPSVNTEAEFDTALDAAIEAAYDEGYEPMDPQDYDTIDRTEEIVTKALRKVEEARERVRQTEREAYPDDSRCHAAQQRNEPKSGGFYDDNLSSDEEERMLEEMTRDDNMESFLAKEDEKASSISQRPASRNKEAQPPGFKMGEQGNASGTRPLATTVDRSALQKQQHPIPKGLQPSAPPPKQSLPELPPTRAASPDQGVRSRRLSGQNPKQLKIQTTQLRQPPPAAGHGEVTQPRTMTETNSAAEATPGERPQTSRPTKKLTAPTMGAPGPAQPTAIMGSPPHRRGQIDAEDGSTGRSGSPTISRLRKNFSSSSLRSLKSRNLSLSNLEDASDMSPGTPPSLHSGSARTPAIPALPTPLIATLREQTESASPGSLYLFEDNIHLPSTPGSPNPMALDPPVALEPCPNDVMLRPFWLMRCLYQTLAHPRGGYLSTKLFVPRDVWKVKGVKLKNVEDKISNCDLLTAALLNLASVDTCDADAMLEEMQALESILEQVQNALSRRLGNEVGVQGSGVLFKEASNVVEGDGAPAVPRTASVSAKPSSFSWRRLRSKNSNMGLGAAHSSRSAAPEGIKEAATMPTLPMTPQPTSRPPRRDITQAQFVGPHANYMSSLARLFDAAQAIDQIARQVEDPGLRHADKTQVGLELCTRHAAEFFGFYVCRFVLTDLGMLLDKFIKRGSEWVLA
ncbi:hypothetical protein C2857_007373 [Epichloe festucae Fl1]|uniref:MIT domain-containing protein n=1 Tax=Epichloe festucae (strain Fl1) TaxID=877507 RepID=A0A7S9KQP5_EPIFF|nr:hypothetical protein C2857_007373 [Epichloe festucae Fl1]